MFDLQDLSTEDVIHCLTVKSLPAFCNWAAAYLNDLDTKFMLERIQSKDVWWEAEVRRLPAAYWDYIRSGRIGFFNGRLVVYNQLRATPKC